MKILEIFEENRLEFIETSKITEIWWMISIGHLNVSNLHAKPCAFGPKMKRNLKNFKKILRFFDQNLYGKLTFFTIFYWIFLGFLTPLRKYRPLEDSTRFLQQFFRFRGGGDVPAFPPPDATEKALVMFNVFCLFSSYTGFRGWGVPKAFLHRRNQ